MIMHRKSLLFYSSCLVYLFVFRTALRMYVLAVAVVKRCKYLIVFSHSGRSCHWAMSIVINAQKHVYHYHTFDEWQHFTFLPFSFLPVISVRLKLFSCLKHGSIFGGIWNGKRHFNFKALTPQPDIVKGGWVLSDENLLKLSSQTGML